MLSITPCPIGWELAEVPGFEPGSRGPKPPMLSATPYLHAVPAGTAVALKESIADQPNAMIVSSTAFPEGLLFHISGRKCAVPHVVSPLVEHHRCITYKNLLPKGFILCIYETVMFENMGRQNMRKITRGPQKQDARL
jgi:hypothetical protein